MVADPRISAVVLEGQAYYGYAIEMLLKIEFGARVLTVTARLPTLWRALHALRPHLVVLDADICAPDVFEHVGAIRTMLPDARLILTTLYLSRKGSERAHAADVPIVFKSGPLDQLRQTLRIVLTEGTAPQTAEFDGRAGSQTPGNGAPPDITASLTLREQQVLDALVSGEPAKKIAANLHISVKTVDFHKTNLMRKLEVHDRVDLFWLVVRDVLGTVSGPSLPQTTPRDDKCRPPAVTTAPPLRLAGSRSHG